MEQKLMKYNNYNCMFKINGNETHAEIELKRLYEIWNSNTKENIANRNIMKHNDL